MKRVILITGAEHYDASSQTSREPDYEVLRRALLERGIDVQVAVWNDPTVDWKHMAQRAIVVIRSSPILGNGLSSRVGNRRKVGSRNPRPRSEHNGHY